MIDEEAMCNGKLWLTAVQNGTNGKTASIKWYFSIFLIFHFSQFWKSKGSSVDLILIGLLTS